VASIANLLFTVIHKQCKEAEMFTTLVNLAALNMGSYISLIVIVKSRKLSAENRDLKIAQLEMYTKTGGGAFRETEKHP
jgi:hypothetical protein